MLKIADPVLTGLAAGKLNELLPYEFHSDRKDFRCLEALGRTLCGIAPWLECEVDADEAPIQDKYRRLARLAIDRATDPASPDFLNFNKGNQPLVDAGFLAHAVIRAPRQLCALLDGRVRQNLANALRSSLIIRPGKRSNWVLFGAMVEAALLTLGEKTDLARIDEAVECFEDSWYLGDGVYGDGPEFHFDYYNSFVIQPMYIDVLRTAEKYSHLLPEALKRAGRYAQIQERMIAPDGSYTVIGRSLCYRFGAFQLLAQAVLQDFLPKSLSYAQIRCALGAVMRRCEEGGMFNSDGWLIPGVCGYQPGLAENYINVGSLYLCSAAFLPLGLPSTHPFWADADEPWTSQKIWTGVDMPVDKHI